MPARMRLPSAISRADNRSMAEAYAITMLGKLLELEEATPGRRPIQTRRRVPNISSADRTTTAGSTMCWSDHGKRIRKGAQKFSRLNASSIIRWMDYGRAIITASWSISNSEEYSGLQEPAHKLRQPDAHSWIPIITASMACHHAPTTR